MFSAGHGHRESVGPAGRKAWGSLWTFGVGDFETLLLADLPLDEDSRGLKRVRTPPWVPNLGVQGLSLFEMGEDVTMVVREGDIFDKETGDKGSEKRDPTELREI